MATSWAMQDATKPVWHISVFVLLSSHLSFLRFPVSLAFMTPLCPDAFPVLAGSFSEISHASPPSHSLNTGIPQHPVLDLWFSSLWLSPWARGLTGSHGFNFHLGTSLVVQWLRICLPVQGTWVWSLVQGTKIPHASGHLSPQASTREASVLQLLILHSLEPVLHKRGSCAATRESLHAATKT